MAKSPSKCNKCPALIRWVKMEASGKANPLDAAPAVNGNVEILDNDVGRVVPAEERSGKTLYISHFATCPAAQHFRKK